MKKIIIGMLLSLCSLSFAMELADQDSVQCRKNTSLLEAFMTGAFEKVTPQVVNVIDFQDPEMVHVSKIEEVNNLLLRIHELLPQYVETKDIKNFKEINTAVDKLNLEQGLDAHDFYNLQVSVVLPFLLNDDLFHVKTTESNKLSANRALYRASWATGNSTKINEVLKLKLYPDNDPYVLLCEKIKAYRESDHD